MKVFTYGTLMTRGKMKDVTMTNGEQFHPYTARVKGVLKYNEDATGVPYPVALLDDSPHASAKGIVWDGVTEEDLRQLDMYENTESGLYKRIKIRADIFNYGIEDVWMYIGTEEHWSHLKNSPHARVNTEVGKFHGYLPRWVLEAMDKNALRPFGTGVYTDRAASWLLLSTESGKMFKVESSLGETKIMELSDESDGSGVEQEITSRQFVRVFDVN